MVLKSEQAEKDALLPTTQQKAKQPQLLQDKRNNDKIKI